MNILIVDDHDVVRQSLGMIIGSEFPRATCVKLERADQCVDALKKETFDLLIQDMNLPDMDGITLTEWILNRYPQQAILIFSMNPVGIFARRLYELGVKGYLNKQADMSEIRTALRTIISEGKPYFSQEYKALSSHNDKGNTIQNPIEKLSKRELVIAQHLAQGRSFDEIADILHIEPSTIRTYKSRIFQKLDVSSMHEFISKATLYKIG
jgi:two-component system invasion response regulator UvrY